MIARPTSTHIAFCIATLAAAMAVAMPLAAEQTQPPTWGACCGTHQWPGAGPGMMGGGGMMGGRGMMGSTMPRHHYAMMNGIPAQYKALSNPLPRVTKTVNQGRAVYAANCADCHGETGQGDGPAAKTLSPPPANLAWLSQMPMAQWDPLMYWAVAEGGKQFGTGMPAFKGKLSKGDTWAVIAYIQAHLPQGH